MLRHLDGNLLLSGCYHGSYHTLKGKKTDIARLLFSIAASTFASACQTGFLCGAVSFFLFVLLLGFDSANAQQAGFSRWVNPFIGTGGHGHTYPGVVLPFGMMQLSPDTRLDGWDGCSGYHYSDSVIYGFSHTHLSGTGCSDYGDILLMPAAQPERDQYDEASPFSHKNEKAEAGYYSVFLDKPKIQVELTGTLHCGMHRYRFNPKDREPQLDPRQWLIVDLKHRDEVLDSKLNLVDSVTLRGYRFSKAWAQNQKIFFEIKLSRPIIWRSMGDSDKRSCSALRLCIW